MGRKAAKITANPQVKRGFCEGCETVPQTTNMAVTSTNVGVRALRPDFPSSRAGAHRASPDLLIGPQTRPAARLTA